MIAVGAVRLLRSVLLLSYRIYHIDLGGKKERNKERKKAKKREVSILANI